MKDLEEAAAAKKKEADLKAARKALKEEVNKKLSDAGAIELVTLRIGKYQKRFESP